MFYCIRKNINNLAAWNYLRGWFPSIKLGEFSSKKEGSERVFEYEEFPNILEFCLGLAKDDQNAVEAMITLVHIHSHKEETLEYSLSVRMGLFRSVKCLLTRRNSRRRIGDGCTLI